MKHHASHIILFDGYCNLCNGMVQFIIKHDPEKKFKFAALQSDKGKALQEAVGLNQHTTDSIVLIKGQVYFTKSTAALLIAKELNRGWRLWSVFLIVPRFMRDVLYDVVAKSRYRIFGKKEECMLPTKENKVRFL